MTAWAAATCTMTTMLSHLVSDQGPGIPEKAGGRHICPGSEAARKLRRLPSHAMSLLAWLLLNTPAASKYPCCLLLLGDEEDVVVMGGEGFTPEEIAAAEKDFERRLVSALG